MITTILIMLAVIILSILSSAMPHTQLIPDWITESVATIGGYVAELDAFFPGLIACLLNLVYIVIATQVAILAVIGVKKIINFLRGTGPL